MKKILLSLCLCFVLIGCGSDPFVGDWVGEYDKQVNLFIESYASSKYRGDGNIYYNNYLCPFQMEGRLKNESLILDWEFYKIHPDDNCFNGFLTNIECSLSNDNEKLSCKIQGGPIFIYERDK